MKYIDERVEKSVDDKIRTRIDIKTKNTKIINMHHEVRTEVLGSVKSNIFYDIICLLYWVRAE